MDIALILLVLFLGTMGLLPVLHKLGYRISFGLSVYRIDIEDDDGDDDADHPVNPRPFVSSMN